MNGRERVLAAIRRQDVDYVPCAPFMNAQDWTQRVGRRWEYPFGPSAAESLDYMTRVMGVDQVVNADIPFHPSPGVSSRTWVEGTIVHKRFSTPAGELEAAIRFTPAWPHGFDIPLFSDYSPAHFVRPWISSPKDVDCLAHILLPPVTHDELEQVRFNFRECRRLAEEHGMPIAVSAGLGLTAGIQLFGPSQLCEASLDAPELVESYLEVEERFGLAQTELALDLGADIIRRNGFYETTDFFSPHQLEAFLGRRLERQIRMVHQAGRIIGYTALSGIVPMLGHLARLGFDCLVAPDFFFKGMDGAAIVERLGKRSSFWTGPSDTLHMPYDDPDAVRAAVREVFRIVGRRGLLVTPCSSSKAVFPWSCVEAMVEEWKHLR